MLAHIIALAIGIQPLPPMEYQRVEWVDNPCTHPVTVIPPYAGYPDSEGWITQYLFCGVPCGDFNGVPGRVGCECARAWCGAMRNCVELAVDAYNRDLCKCWNENLGDPLNYKICSELLIAKYNGPSGRLFNCARETNQLIAENCCAQVQGSQIPQPTVVQCP